MAMDQGASQKAFRGRFSMQDLTRREFLHTVAGAAVGSTIANHNAFLHSEAVAASFTPADHGNRASLPFQSLIFPKPQEISSSGGDFVLDNQVRIVVPMHRNRIYF
jgi:hypothetical protein